MATLKQSIIWARKFLMVSSTDHHTGVTGLGSSITIKASKGPSGATVTVPEGPGGYISELDTTNLPGWYQVALTVQDTNAPGDTTFVCTATGCDPATFTDQVQTTIFSDLLLTNGRMAINSALVQSQPFNGFDFLMVDPTGAPKTGLSVAAQVSLAGASFVSAHNTPTELSNGIYTHTFIATDLNAKMIVARYSATGAADLDIGIIPPP